MTNRKLAFIHTSPAAIAPLMGFYTEAAHELEITNLLDDGILRLLAANDYATVRARLADMIRRAAETYHAELAMVTCSSVSKEIVEELNSSFPFPVLKIDLPMAQRAVRAGGTVGVAATFPPTLAPTTKLINEVAAEAGTKVEIITEVAPAAYDALLTNNATRHDELLLDSIAELERRGASVIVLAQVSMARILPRLDGRANVPVLSSLQTSLEAIRERL